MIEHLLHLLVCERFKSDARYREGHLRVVNALPERCVMGLHSPEIKQVAKQFSREGGEVVMPDETRQICANGAEIIRAFEAVPSESLCYEETVIWGYLINLEKCSLDERLAMLGRYVPVLDNWAVCDSYCAHAKWMARADKVALWVFLEQWFDSEREFEVRFAVVVAMCYFLNEDWLVRVFARSHVPGNHRNCSRLQEIAASDRNNTAERNPFRLFSEYIPDEDEHPPYGIEKERHIKCEEAFLA